MKQIRMLARYKAWADDLLLVAVGTLPADELAAPRAIVFGSLIRTLQHVWAMDHVWRCHLLGTPIGGGRGSMTRGDILLHVVNHTTYHRGHVADMLYSMHVTPPTTDLPVFLRDAPDWR